MYKVFKSNRKNWQDEDPESFWWEYFIIGKSQLSGMHEREISECKHFSLEFEGIALSYTKPMQFICVDQAVLFSEITTNYNFIAVYDSIEDAMRYVQHRVIDDMKPKPKRRKNE